MLQYTAMVYYYIHNPLNILMRRHAWFSNVLSYLYMLRKRFIICKSSRSICYCIINNVLFTTYESRKMFCTKWIECKMFSAKHI